MVSSRLTSSQPSWVERVLGLLASVVCAISIVAIFGGLGIGAYLASQGSREGATLGFITTLQGFGGLVAAALVAFPWEVLRRLRSLTDRLDEMAAERAVASIRPVEQWPAVDSAPSRFSVADGPPDVSASAPVSDAVEYHPPARQPCEPAPVVRIRYRRPGGGVRERIFEGKSVEFVARQATRQGYDVLQVVEVGP